MTILGVATSKRLVTDKGRRRFAPGGGFPQTNGTKTQDAGSATPPRVVLSSVGEAKRGAFMIWVEGGHCFSPNFDDHESQKARAVPALFGVILCAVAIATLTIGLSQPAQALPSFARQTGQPCGTCHTDFPGLTPYGRLFKLNGYTTGGGKFRTTLFPSQDDATNALAAYAKKFGAGRDSDAAKTGQPDTSNIWVPPISMMAIVGYTHTQADQPASSPYKPNNNVVVAPLSFFYGGAITDHIGAFAQVTYNNAAFGGSAPGNFNPDPCANCQWSWDNTDIRYANTFSLGNMDVIYGITANNNPSVQDPWNTTPAWGFPYADSTIAPGPAAATLIDGPMRQYVGGVGGYAFINNLVYLELTGYRTIAFKTLPKLGQGPAWCRAIPRRVALLAGRDRTALG